jgi:hypothetical protein
MTRDTLKKWDTEADDIMAEHHRLEAEGDDLFRRYRSNQAQKRAEFTQMRDAIRDLSGANLPNEAEASPASSNSLPASNGATTQAASAPETSKPIEAPAAQQPHRNGIETTARPVLQGAPFSHQ